MRILPGLYPLRLISLFAGSPKLAARILGDGEAIPSLSVSALDPKKILKRRFDFEGCTVEIPGRIFWEPADATEAWLQRFYEFRWLGALAAAGNLKLASSLGREFIYGFVSSRPHLPQIAFDPEVLGARVAAWLNWRHFLLKGGSIKFRKRYFRCLVREIRALHAAREEALPLPLAALHGLISAVLYFRELRFLLPLLLADIEGSLKRDVLGDGMHRSLNPSAQLHYLLTALELQALLAHFNLTSAPLNQTLEKMASFLLYLRHGDGRLALFYGGLMEDALLIATAAQAAKTKSPTYAAGRDSGFLRLQHHQTMVLIAGRSSVAEASPYRAVGSMEISDSQERIVVNCGYFHGKSESWHRATQQGAAHSAPSIFRKESPSILSSHLQPAPLPGVEAAAGLQLADNILTIAAEGSIAATEHLFLPGIIHRREIEMESNGRLIEGKDAFRFDSTAERPGFLQLSIRFHLHPDIRCQHPEGNILLLTSVQGRIWQFSANDLPVQIEESVYLGYYGKPQKTLQLVLTPPLILPKTEITWQLKKL